MTYPFAPDVPSDGVAGRCSVVVVHYRGVEDLRRCAESVLANADDVELIVVDNGSEDRGAAQLADDPRLRRVLLPTNQGFAAGANAGLDVATGELVLLLNPDATLRPGALGRLRGALDEADVAVPAVVLADDPDRLDSAGHVLFPDGLNLCRGRGEPVREHRDLDGVVLFSGAAVALRRSALARIGGLDEGYWAYGEDADLALRVARAGLRVAWVPEAVVTHRVGGSFGRFPLRKAFLVERNRARVALAHLPASWLVAAPVWTAARVLGLGVRGAAGQGLAGGFEPRARALLPVAVGLAWAAALLGAPGSLARRRALGPMTPAYRARLADARVGLGPLLRRGRL